MWVCGKYTWPGSNWRPSACEADVIATRPQVHVQCLPAEYHVAGPRASVIDVRVVSGSRIKRRCKPPWQLNTRLHCRDSRRRPRQAACRWRRRLAAPHRVRAANRARCSTFACACRCNSRGPQRSTCPSLPRRGVERRPDYAFRIIRPCARGARWRCNQTDFGKVRATERRGCVAHTRAAAQILGRTTRSAETRDATMRRPVAVFPSAPSSGTQHCETQTHKSQR